MRSTSLMLFLLSPACASTLPAPSTPALPAASAAVLPVTSTPELGAALEKLSFLRGTWAGTATGTRRDGSTFQITQTERAGPMLGGDVLAIEGRGYESDGRTSYNAFAIVSYDPAQARYEIRAYAKKGSGEGSAGTFPLEVTPDGYVWETPAGPNAKMRFTATVHGDTWREIGEYVAADGTRRQSFEMNLRRRGDTDWPLGSPVTP